MSSEPRVQSEGGFMLDLIREIADGKAAPAAFQRPFVWGKDDVEAFWESILRGYPLGAFLLWRPVNPGVNGRDMLGPIKFQKEARSALILDGQNRLVTVAWSMTNIDAQDFPPDSPGIDLFAKDNRLIADPYARKVHFVAAEKIEKMMMPIHYLFEGMNEFFRRQWSDDQDDKAMAWLDDLAYKFRQARIVRTMIENATAEEARDAFLHISRAGVPMSAEDFDNALKFGLS